MPVGLDFFPGLCKDAILHVCCVHQLLDGICNPLEDPWHIFFFPHTEPGTRYTQWCERGGHIGREECSQTPLKEGCFLLELLAQVILCSVPSEKMCECAVFCPSDSLIHGSYS